MLKNIVISILGGVILSDNPWMTYDQSEKWVIIMGISVLLLFFCLFLEETAEKMLRVRKIRQILQQLRNLKLRR